MLNCNEISDLFPSDPLLIGSNDTLESVDLEWSRISEKDVLNFFRKLPQMKRLRRLSLGNNPFHYSGRTGWAGDAITAVWRNKSLEFLAVSGVRLEHVRKSFVKETCVPLSLNRGGRGALEAESSLPANLWPLVLKRATKIEYEASAMIAAINFDVVYWMLKEKIAGQVATLL